MSNKDKSVKSEKSSKEKDGKAKDKDKKKLSSSKNPVEKKLSKSPSKIKEDKPKKETTIPTLTNIETSEKLDIDKFNETFKQGNELHSNEKCDGCFDGEGLWFCNNCEKIYCKNCEEQLHMVPANRNHDRYI